MSRHYKAGVQGFWVQLVKTNPISKTACGGYQKNKYPEKFWLMAELREMEIQHQALKFSFAPSFAFKLAWHIL